MSVLAAIRIWWRAIAHRARTHDEVAEEFQHHLDSYANDLIQGGMTHAQAKRKAQIDLGLPGKQNEEYRAAIGLGPLDEVAADLRYGLRSLRKNPGFSGVAVLSIALGIGATTAMFSLIYAVLMHPFPYADSGRIMNPVLINEDRPQEVRWFALTKPQFETLGHAKAIETLLGFRNVDMEITGDALPEDVSAIYLTENADKFFGVKPFLGRGIQPSDAQASSQPIVVLNYKFWQRHFNGDPSVIGRALQLEHANYIITGVMPRAFAFNDTLGVGDIYLPRNLLHDSINPPIAWPYTPWIKLKAGLSVSAANAELDAVVRQFAKENPSRYPRRFHLQLQPIVLPFQQNTGHALGLLLIGVLLLLAIGCVNCSVLLLARGRARQHELAIRSAIGASRWRIVRQLLVEACVISFAGAILGVAASYWLARLPLQLSPGSFPSESIVRINPTILWFSAGLALVCGLLFGLIPALRSSRPDLAFAMQSSSPRTAGHSGKQRLNPLVAGQIALTFLLMAVAGTAIGTFLHLSEIPLGYNPRNVMQAGVVMHWNRPKEWQSLQSREGRVAFVEQIRQRIATVPGVISVSVGNDATPPYSGVAYKFDISGVSSDEQREARIHLVGPEFFGTLQIPLLKGRIWDQAENARGDFVAVVNQSFADRYWPRENPIGRQLRIPSLKATTPLLAASAASDGWRQVIGVIADVRNDGIDRPVVPAIYLPYTAVLAPYAQFQIRTQAEPLALLNSIRTAVQSVSSDQQVANGAYDLQEAIERDSQWSRQRLFSVLFGVFSALALVLALVGLFGLVSYSVAQRTAEFGVRMALGATRAHILWVATRIAIRSVVVGIVFGLGVDLCIHKALLIWMNGSVSGVKNLLEVTLLLVFCAIGACLIPASRALSVQPIEALRYE